MNLPATFSDHISKGLAADPADQDEMDERILDAALTCVSNFGIHRPTMDDVAAAAQVGRATVFRRFGTKNELMRRLVSREIRTIGAAVVAASDAFTDPAERLTAWFVASVTESLNNPLVDRTIRDDSIVELVHNAAYYGLVRSNVINELGEAKRLGKLRAGLDVALAADAIVRQMASYLLIPLPHTPHVDELRSVADVVLGGVLETGSSATPPPIGLSRP